MNRNASAFAGLREHLSLSFDDFIRTSSDPRHRPGVERLWRACEASGDLYRKTYQGLYCVGCEQFYTEAELTGGNCPDHGTPPQLVSEENWFFRLSRYAGQLHDLISSGRLRIEPASRRNEVLGFIAGGLEDFSASRSVARARGWGIGVPGDPSQVIYVWWDALGNYITSLNYGASGAQPRGADYQRWWAGADRRMHVVGKGVLRFHAVYWPAILLSAGEPLPTEIFVHDYLTIDGRKISKSAPAAPLDGNDPVALPARYGADALRWWLLREVPRVGDTDFTVGQADRQGQRGPRQRPWQPGQPGRVARPFLPERGRPALRSVRTGTSRWLAAAADGRSGGAAPEHGSDWPGLAGRRCRPAGGDRARAGRGPGGAGQVRLPGGRGGGLARSSSRRTATSRRPQPWHLARAERAGDTAAGVRLDQVLGALIAACQVLAAEIWPFLPDLAARVAAACNDFGGTLPAEPVFPRIEPRRSEQAERPGRASGEGEEVA